MRTIRRPVRGAPYGKMSRGKSRGRRVTRKEQRMGAAPAGRWFGDFELAECRTGHWRLGPLQLWIHHCEGEWRLRYRHDEDLLDPRAEVSFEDGTEADDEAERYVLSDRGGRLNIQPLLPERSVVSRPAAPVFVPAGESVRIYVSVPLWLQVAVGELRKVLREVPTMRPSDTWFGPSNMVGELCYAMRTRCRLNHRREDSVPSRATVPVLIRNHTSKLLGLERVSVPARQLGLYVTAEGQLWTEEVTLDRHDDRAGFAALRFGDRAPAEALGAERIGEPRDPPPRKTAIHAFSALFSG